MSKPYIVFVTGSFAPPPFYDNIVALIKDKGYEIKVLHLPTVGLGPGKGRPGPPPSMYDDADFIAKEVETLADAGREIVLFAHSYGGMPATQSTKGLSIQERQKAGKTGGIKRLAYKTVILTDVGQSSLDFFKGAAWSPDFKPDDDGWFRQENPELSAPYTFSDLSTEEALVWNAKFSFHSARSFTDPLDYAGYRDIPVSYLLCEKDQIISPELQQKGIDLINAAKKAGNAGEVDVTRFQSGHCPNTFVPKEVVEWIIATANKS
ncbi:alpha/beta-hydrolase [Nemania abortiva]|nr:alpha/beta-hydrolase [Nemania abortiva]